MAQGTMDKVTLKERWYLLTALVLVAIYSMHLFRFTLFNGFATLSSDSASYVLLARKWSPYFTPEQADILTWPVVAYPPGLPWLLAVSGASESLFLSHLLVSLCLLAAILLMSWISCRKLGPITGIFLTVNFCLLPGIILQSMGILSENLYLLLSLVTLVVFARIRKIPQPSWMPYLLLFISLCLAIMTRTIGVALLAAIGFVALFERGMQTSKRLKLTGVVILAGVMFIGWKFIDPQRGIKTYTDAFAGFLGNSAAETSGNLAGLLLVVFENLKRLPLAWNHYFNLTHDHLYFFIFSLTLLVLSVYTLLHRAARLKPDSIYIVFYLLILLVWPYYIDARFLHPVMFLILLQPLLFIKEKHLSKPGRVVMAVVLAGLTFNSLIIQYELQKILDWADTNEPQVAHMYDLYNDLGRDPGPLESNLKLKGLPLARGTANILQAMAQSASSVPEGNTVATIKPTFYAMVSNRSAVHLISMSSLEEQFCQLKRQAVSQIFISRMTNEYNPFGLNVMEYYQPFLANIQPLRNGQNSIEAVIAQLDHDKIKGWLEEKKSHCLE